MEGKQNHGFTHVKGENGVHVLNGHVEGENGVHVLNGHVKGENGVHMLNGHVDGENSVHMLNGSHKSSLRQDSNPHHERHVTITVPEKDDTPDLISHDSSQEEENPVKVCCKRFLNSCCLGCRNDCKDFWTETKKVYRRAKQVKYGQKARQCCNKEKLYTRLPITRWLPKYRLRHLQGDIIAGLTVALTVLPQGLAYALIAQLPPQYGLYASFMGCFVYCILGGSKEVGAAVGPTAMLALMSATFSAEPTNGLSEADRMLIEECVNPQMAAFYAFGSGLVGIAMGLIGVGFMINYISHPVIKAFQAAAALTIACSQVKGWLGLTDIPGEFGPQLRAILEKLGESKKEDAFLGIGCAVVIYVLKRLREVSFQESAKYPRRATILRKVFFFISISRNALIVIVCTGMSYGLYVHGQAPFSLVGNVVSGLPSFGPPSFGFECDGSLYGSNLTITRTVREMISVIRADGFILAPIIGLMESITLIKIYSRQFGYKYDADQELMAFGASNAVGGFVQSMYTTGAFSRMVVNCQSGVMTQASGVVSGLIVVLSLAFITEVFFYIPKAALSMVVIMAVLDMLDFSILIKLWMVKKSDLIPWLVTFVLALALGIEMGILVGVGVNLLLLLYPWSRPQIKKTLYESPELSAAMDNNPDQRGVVIVTLNQGLRYPSVDYVRQKIVDAAKEGGENKHAIFDCRHIASLDYSAIMLFHEIIQEFQTLRTQVVAVNLKPSLEDMIHQEGMKLLKLYHTLDDALVALVPALMDNTKPQDVAIIPHHGSDVLSLTSHGSEHRLPTCPSICEIHILDPDHDPWFSRVEPQTEEAGNGAGGLLSRGMSCPDGLHRATQHYLIQGPHVNGPPAARRASIHHVIIDAVRPKFIHGDDLITDETPADDTCYSPPPSPTSAPHGLTFHRSAFSSGDLPSHDLVDDLPSHDRVGEDKTKDGVALESFSSHL